MTHALQRRLEIGFGLTILAILVLFFVIGLSYPPKTRELPILVDSVGIIITTLHLVNVLRQGASSRTRTVDDIRWRSVFLAFGSMILYLILSYFIGMVLSSAVIVYGCGRAFGARSRTKMGIISVLTVFVIYLLFVKILGVQLYAGILFGGM